MFYNLVLILVVLTNTHITEHSVVNNTITEETSALIETDLQRCAVRKRKYEPQKAFKPESGG